MTILVLLSMGVLTGCKGNYSDEAVYYTRELAADDSFDEYIYVGKTTDGLGTIEAYNVNDKSSKILYTVDGDKFFITAVKRMDGAIFFELCDQSDPKNYTFTTYELNKDGAGCEPVDIGFDSIISDKDTYFDTFIMSDGTEISFEKTDLESFSYCIQGQSFEIDSLSKYDLEHAVIETSRITEVDGKVYGLITTGKTNAGDIRPEDITLYSYENEILFEIDPVEKTNRLVFVSNNPMLRIVGFDGETYVYKDKGIYKMIDTKNGEKLMDVSLEKDKSYSFDWIGKHLIIKDDKDNKIVDCI